MTGKIGPAGALSIIIAFAGDEGGRRSGARWMNGTVHIVVDGRWVDRPAGVVGGWRCGCAGVETVCQSGIATGFAAGVETGAAAGV